MNARRRDVCTETLWAETDSFKESAQCVSPVFIAQIKSVVTTIFS